jgi:hypothetical protein
MGLGEALPFHGLGFGTRDPLGLQKRRFVFWPSAFWVRLMAAGGFALFLIAFVKGFISFQQKTNHRFAMFTHSRLIFSGLIFFAYDAAKSPPFFFFPLAPAEW